MQASFLTCIKKVHLHTNKKKADTQREKKNKLEMMGPREKLVSDDFLVSGFSPDEPWLSARRYYFVLITY